MKDKFNFIRVNKIEPYVCSNYEDAKRHAEAGYWVSPVQINDEKAAHSFDLHFKVTDVAESGKVHYART